MPGADVLENLIITVQAWKWNGEIYEKWQGGCQLIMSQRTFLFFHSETEGPFEWEDDRFTIWNVAKGQTFRKLKERIRQD